MRISRRTIVAGVLVVVAAIAVAAVLLTADSGDRPDVDPSIAQHQNYHQAQYSAGVTNAWPQDESDQRTGGYLESSWHDPLNPAAALTIYSRTADETGSPTATADLARVQIDKLPGFHERGLEEIGLRDNPAVRWTFDLSGANYVEHFFEECGISFVVRVSAPAGVWGELSSAFRRMATLVTANCDE